MAAQNGIGGANPSLFSGQNQVSIHPGHYSDMQAMMENMEKLSETLQRNREEWLHVQDGLARVERLQVRYARDGQLPAINGDAQCKHPYPLTPPPVPVISHGTTKTPLPSPRRRNPNNNPTPRHPRPSQHPHPRLRKHLHGSRPTARTIQRHPRPSHPTNPILPLPHPSPRLRPAQTLRGSAARIPPGDHRGADDASGVAGGTQAVQRDG